MGLRVAVTGGARGIGLATARAFARAGAWVVIGDVDAAAGEAAAADIGATARVLDVRSAASCREFVDAAGDLDVFVNNAGVVHAGTFLSTPPELRELQLDVNLRGVVNGMAAALPGMVERGRGHVVNVASLAGRVPTPQAATYTASKFAVVGLTEAVRAELRGSGVRLTAVLPTFVRTEMIAGLSLKGIPQVEASDVAGAIVRAVRRGGPPAVVVPRWLGMLPRLAAFVPHGIVDALRSRATGDQPDLDGTGPRAAYLERVRGLLDHSS